MDLAFLAEQTATLIDQLSLQYGEDAEINTVMLLVEVKRADGGSDFIAESSDDRPWFQIAYMDEHRYEIEGRRDAMEEATSEDEEDDD